MSIENERQELLEQSFQAYRNSNKNIAIGKLAKILEIDKKTGDYKYDIYYFKATWEIELKKYTEAIDTLINGINFVGQAPNLFVLLAQCYIETNTDLYKAQNLLEEAEEYLKNNKNVLRQEKSRIREARKKIEEYYELQDELSDIRNTITTLRIRSVAILSENTINIKLEELNKKVESDRIRHIEILAIFTAILSLIIISGQFIVQLKYLDAVRLLALLSLILLIFASYISIINITPKGKWYLKILDVRILIVVSGILLLFKIINNAI